MWVSSRVATRTEEPHSPTDAVTPRLDEDAQTSPWSQKGCAIPPFHCSIPNPVSTCDMLLRYVLTAADIGAIFFLVGQLNGISLASHRGGSV